MKKQLTYFFALTFLASWLLWLPTVLHASWRPMPPVLLMLGMLAGFAPSVLGIIFLTRETGIKPLQYLKNSLSLRFGYRWLFYLLLFPLQAATSLYLVQRLDTTYVVAQPIPLAFAPLVFLQILFLGGALGEEFGWRGYALKRLTDIMGAFKATLLLGFLWSLWHLPLFFMIGTVQSNLPLGQFMVQNTLMGFFYTYLFTKTGGKMVPMILLHATANTAAAMFPYWQTDLGRYIGFTVLVVLLLGTYGMDVLWTRHLTAKKAD